jgi:hypothetical protein
MSHRRKAASTGSNRRQAIRLGCVLAAAIALTVALGATLASAVAPSVTVDDASDVQYTTAKASGEVDPQDKETFCRFDYVTDAQFGQAENGGFAEAAQVGCDVEPLTGSGLQPVQAQLSGLAPDTTYHLRLVASNEDGQSEAVASETFTTKAVAKPVVTNPAASAVGYTVAQLSAEVTAGGEDEAFNTFCRFEYVTDAQFQQAENGGFAEASSAGCDVEPVTGAGATEVKAALSGLLPGTLYHLRLVAENANGANRSESEAPFPTFETDAVAKPVVTIDAPSAITDSSADFAGTVNPNAPEAAPVADPDVEAAFRTSWHFECTPACPGVPGGEVEADDAAHTVEADATGLQPNTTYTVKLVAANAGGSTESSLEEFTTDAIGPEVATGTNTPYGPGQTLVRAYVNPHNSAVTACSYEYGPTAAYGQSVPCDSLPANGNKPTEVTAHIAGLTPGATYHFRVSATNVAGSAASADGVFTSFEQEASPACPNAGRPGAGFLPDCRAWELVSPPDKNGGDVAADSARTRAAADGNAVGFISLTGFGDVQGTGIAVDYLAERSDAAAPGDNGWYTHAITAPQEAMSINAVQLTAIEAMYLGDFSPDLGAGIFFGWSPLTDDPYVKDVVNLYRRSDLHSAGAGSYELITACPLCEETSTPLAPLPGIPNFLAGERAPFLAATSPDLEHAIFESKLRLSADTPLQANNRARLYQWDEGVTRLAGRIPVGSAIACDDVNGPACTAADVSVAGQGAGTNHATWRTPHTVSDGSDGHVRVFFTRPTLNGTSLNVNGFTGKLYMRLDHSSTAQLNASERTEASGFEPAHFLDASADGTRAFFMSKQPLTDDAPDDGQDKLYMYDATKPASATDNLTFLSADGEPADHGRVVGLIGASAGGDYVYFVAEGQLVAGAPLGNDPKIYLWHEGELSYIAPQRGGTSLNEVSVVGSNWIQLSRQARVSADGRHLLFAEIGNAATHIGPTGYDHGACETGLGTGCRELYLYAADTAELSCASCNPTGATATEMATTGIRANTGATRPSWNDNRVLTEDGSRTFFSSGEALVPEDTNGTSDAYEYDAATGKVHLLSSGTSSSESWFMNAGADGGNAFLLTREALVGWDVDSAYDLYAARSGGGFPEPPPVSAPCSGDSCRSSSAVSPAAGSPASAGLIGPGDRKQRRGKPRCRKGRHVAKVRGKKRCVKNQPKRTANANRRAGR